MSQMYTLTASIYLDNFDKNYKKIITINNQPAGPLSTYVKKINLPTVSPFKSPNLSSCCNCNYAIYKISNTSELMTPDDIPELFSFLVANSYTIDTSITQMMQTSNVKMDNPIICFIKY